MKRLGALMQLEILNLGEYMIIKDGMTAVLVKGEYIYHVKRVSDPEKDCIYEEFG